MKLGTKLRIGFAIPVVMLLTSGVWSYLRFAALTRSVDAMLRENDRSIQAANEMILALERLDSAALMHVAGQRGQAEGIMAQADSSYFEAFQVAKGNETIDTEPVILDSLQTFFAGFRESIAALVREPTFQLYRTEVLPAFLETKHAVSRLRRVNQVEMQDRAVQIGRRAYRASLPSVTLAMAAVLFTALFAWLTHVYVVVPLARLVRRAKSWAETGRYDGGKIDTGDEIQELDEALVRAFFRMKRPDGPR